MRKVVYTCTTRERQWSLHDLCEREALSAVCRILCILSERNVSEARMRALDVRQAESYRT